MRKIVGVVLCSICVCFLLGLPLFAQVNSGRILGTVTDQTGGVIAGAMVTVTNSETGVARNLVADQAGEYVAPEQVSVEAVLILAAAMSAHAAASASSGTPLLL